MEAHNIHQIIGNLSSAFSGRQLTDDKMRTYNKIDDCITEGMLAAERRLPRQQERRWTAEINSLVHRVQYYSLLLQRTKGFQTHKAVLQKSEGPCWS